MKLDIQYNLCLVTLIVSDNCKSFWCQICPPCLIQFASSCKFLFNIKIFRFIVTAWILSLVPSVPNLFIFNITTLKKTVSTQNTTDDELHNLLDYQTRQECVSDFAVFPSETVTKGYMISVFLVIFVIPLVSRSKVSQIVSY